MTPSDWGPARARAWLEDLQRRGTLLGLARVEAIAERLGHPERTFPAVLVAGTSGKGSVTALVESMLRAGGRRTGRYTSPHLIDWPERITVAGNPIGEEELACALEAVAEDVERVEATPFEALTIAAFLHFRSVPVDSAVVEVGLGGRLDATRICRAEVTAVTAIGVDHVAELGADPAGIAREKGAIARPGAPMVLGPDTQSVRAVLEEQVAAIGTETVWAADRVGLEAVEDVWGWRGRAIWQGPAAEVARRQGEEVAFDWQLPLAGEHMLHNLTTALAVVSCLRQRGWKVPTSAFTEGIAALDWPGRLQLVAPPPGRPTLLLEVGHNTLAARAVAAHLARRLRPHRRLVMAIARDKDVAGVLDCLLPGTEEVIATTWGGPRALEPEELARCALQRARSAGRELSVATAPDPVTAVARAGQGLREDGLIVALGSHMLVGPLLAALRRPDARSLLWP